MTTPNISTACVTVDLGACLEGIYDVVVSPVTFAAVDLGACLEGIYDILDAAEEDEES